MDWYFSLHPLSQITAIWLAYLMIIGGLALLWLSWEMERSEMKQSEMDRSEEDPPDPTSSAAPPRMVIFPQRQDAEHTPGEHSDEEDIPCDCRSCRIEGAMYSTDTLHPLMQPDALLLVTEASQRCILSMDVTPHRQTILLASFQHIDPPTTDDR